MDTLLVSVIIVQKSIESTLEYRKIKQINALEDKLTRV